MSSSLREVKTVTPPAEPAQPLFYQNVRGDMVKITYGSDNKDEFFINLDDVNPDEKEAHDGRLTYRPGRGSELELKHIQSSPPGTGAGSFLMNLLLLEADKLKLTQIRTLNTFPAAFPFYRSLGFVGDAKTPMVTGTSTNRDGKEVQERDCTEWLVETERCRKIIEEKRKPETSWNAIPADYNKLLCKLESLGVLDPEVCDAIKKDVKVLDGLEVSLHELLAEKIAKVGAHKAGSGFNLRAHDTILQKRKVLLACKNYLEGTIDKVQLEKHIEKNPKYSVSIGASHTKTLVDEVLAIKAIVKTFILRSPLKKAPTPFEKK